MWARARARARVCVCVDARARARVCGCVCVGACECMLMCERACVCAAVTSRFHGHFFQKTVNTASPCLHQQQKEISVALSGVRERAHSFKGCKLTENVRPYMLPWHGVVPSGP